MKATEMRIDNDLVSVSVEEDAVRHCLRVLARTSPVRQIRELWYKDVSSQPCYWTHSRWAKVVRWMLRKKYLNRLIPYPIECLANATEVAVVPRVWQIPEEVDASIKAQLAGWSAADPPSLILIGRSAHYELIKCQHFSTMPVWAPDTNSKFTIHGISAIVTDKIEQNAVIVI